jgi:hypothetical protein
LRAIANFPGWEVRYVYSAREAIKALSGEPRFSILHLDHDLDLVISINRPQTPDLNLWKRYESTVENDSGCAVARFVVSHLSTKKLPGKVIIHSTNTEGAMAMVHILRQRISQVSYEPFDGDCSCLLSENGCCDTGKEKANGVIYR